MLFAMCARLSAMVLAIIAAGMAAAAAQETAPRFEVASVKPNVGADRSIPSGPRPPTGSR